MRQRKSNQQLERDVRRWLSAERSGNDRDAEQALAQAFFRLPLASPSRQFADRVMARVLLSNAATVPSQVTLWRRKHWRSLAAAMLMLPAIGLFLAALWSAQYGVSGLMERAATGVSAAAQSMVGLLGMWEKVADLGRGLAPLLETPGAVLLAGCALAISLMAFRALSQMVPQQGSLPYGNSI